MLRCAREREDVKEKNKERETGWRLDRQQGAAILVLPLWWK